MLNGVPRRGRYASGGALDAGRMDLGRKYAAPDYDPSEEPSAPASADTPMAWAADDPTYNQSGTGTWAADDPTYGGAPGALFSPPPPSTPAAQIAANKQAQDNLGKQVQNQQDTAILTAGGAAPPSVITAAIGAPGTPSGASGGLFGGGTVNLPLLAAAGGMLRPTRSGTFSEALGNAFDAAVPAIEKQRSLEETSRLRQATLEQNRAIWGDRSAINRDKNDITRERMEAYRTGIQGRLAVQQRANELKTQGMDETAAHHRAMEELGQGRLDALVTHYADQAQNYDSLDSSRERRGEQGDRSLTLREGELAAKITRMKQTDEYHQANMALRAKIADQNSTDRIMTRATYLAAQRGMPLAKAVEQVLHEQKGLAPQQPVSTPAAPAAPAPSAMSDADRQASLANARAAIAGGKDKNAVIQKLRAAGIDPSGL